MIGETHMDGELIGTAAWAVRKELGAAIADPLIWGAMSMLTSSCTLGDWGKNVLQGVAEQKTAGNVSDAQEKAVVASLHARGLDDCSRFLAVDSKTPRTTTMIGLDLVGYYMGGDCLTLRNDYGFAMTSLFHFQYQAKSTDTQVKFQADLTAVMGGGSDWDWDMIVRKTEPVLFATSPMGMSLSLDQYDYALEHINKAKGEIIIDAKSTPAFDPTALYDLVIFHRNCPSARAVVKVAAEVAVPDAGPDATLDAPPPAKEAGPLKDGGKVDAGAPVDPLQDKASVEGGGCGCHAAGSLNPRFATGMLFCTALVMAARRRRRRAD
jgi:hypothetical protein